MTMKDRPAVAINGDPIFDDIDPDAPKVGPSARPTIRRVNPAQEPAVVAATKTVEAETSEASKPYRSPAPRIGQKQRVNMPSTGSGYVGAAKVDWRAGAEKHIKEVEEQLKAANQAQMERETGNQGLKRIRELEDKVAWLETNLITLMERVESGLAKQDHPPMESTENETE